jgi:TRAP-type uncharacterized transport system fused permease subunit
VHYENDVNRRPEYLTIVGCLIATAGFIGMLYALFQLTTIEVPPWLAPEQELYGDVQLCVMGVLSLLFFISGVYILQAKRWARWLYVATCVLYLGYCFVFFSENYLTLVPSTVLYLILVVFLFLPKANDYFAERYRRKRYGKKPQL